MSIASTAVRRPVATVAATLAIVLLGSVSLSQLPVSLLPDVSLPVLTIRTLYPGTAAPEVSRFVAEPIEQAIAATPGLVELRSVSRNGESTTTARFTWGTDMRTTVLHVREQLDATRGALPERAERPTLLTSDPGERPIAVLAARSTDPGANLRSLARIAEEVHSRRLEQVAGVASVAVAGAPQDQIRIDIDPDKLRALDLTADDVAQAIRRENATGLGGTIRRGQFRYSIRTLTEYQNTSEILDTPIGAPGNGVTLRDLATVSIGLADPVTLTRVDGAPAIGLVVYKDAGSNTVAVTGRMMEAVKSLEQEFPDVSITVVATQADFVVDALTNLGQEIIAGGLLAFFAILLFLRNWRMSVAICLVVPLSIMVSLVTLQALGVTINVLSLGGLALATGLLVDTAIVVAESVGRRFEEGMTLGEAAVVGTEEVTAPLVAGVLTTVLVFGPIIFVRGLAAALFRDLSLSVVVTVAASLVLALTLMPVMIVGRRSRSSLTFTPTPAGKERPIARILDTIGDKLVGWYETGMHWSVHNPGKVFALGGALLAVTIYIIGQLPREILPKVDEGVLVVQVQLPEGTAIENTQLQVARIERAARDGGSMGVYSRIGVATDEEILAGASPGSSATAELIVPVPDGTNAAQFSARLREAVPDLAQGALAIDPAGQSEFGSLIGREGRLVRVELSAGTPDEALRWADSVRTVMAALPSLADVRDAYSATQPVIEISLERERLAERGISPAAIASALSGALGGVTASEFRETDRRTPITVRYAGLRNEDLTSALQTMVWGVPVGQLVRVKEVRAPLEVVRIGQRPVTIVEAIVEEGGLAKASAEVDAQMQKLDFPTSVSWEVAGAEAERKRTSSEFTLVAVLAALLMFLVLAGEFASFTIPLVVMLTVPLAGAGGIIFLWMTGQSLNAVSLIGIVVMIGMADNEAVVKLDAIRKFREEGYEVEEAIIRGGRQRLRAIAMTSLTTVAGVLPLVFGWGSGGALYQPLAAGIIGGVFSALGVTFFMVPAAYALLERRKRPGQQ